MARRRGRARQLASQPPVPTGPTCRVVRVTYSVVGGRRTGSCGAAVPPGVVVCGRCADELLTDLVHVPGIALALEAAHGRQLRFGASVLPPSFGLDGVEREEESALPFDPRASEAAAMLLDTLTRWADLIAGARGLFRPLDTWTALPAWLCGQVSWLRSAECGPEAVVKVRGAIRQARLVVDRPPDLVYVGPCSALVRTAPRVCGCGVDLTDQAGLLAVTCPGCARVFAPRVCGADLYARPGRDVTEVACRECGARFPIGDRRAWLLEQAQDRLLPATELARAIDGLGVDVTPSAIWKWKERGRLVPHGADALGHPLYRVGDVMDLVDATVARSTPRH